MYENCDALVLRRRAYSETSYTITLFTREFGRVDVLAKGARRPHNEMFGHFDFLEYEQITLFRRGMSGLDLATAAASYTDFPHLRRHPLSYAAAGVMVEVLLIACQPHDPHPRLFDRLIARLENLEKAGNPFGILTAALLDLLRELGFAPRLENCAICGEMRVEQAVLSERGGLICARCWNGDPDRLLSRVNLTALRGLAGRQNGLRQHDGVVVLRALIIYAQAIFSRKLASFHLFEQLSQSRRGTTVA